MEAAFTSPLLASKIHERTAQRKLCNPNGRVVQGGDAFDPFDISNRVPTGSTINDEESYEENGRMYSNHKDSSKLDTRLPFEQGLVDKAEAYFLPNDGEEQDRLDIQHAAMKEMFEGHLYLAPISEPKYVLDVATGTGLWAVDFAKQHPHATVLGTDISLIQPGPDRCPPNVSFERDNAEAEEWVFAQRFDFVHLRATMFAFSDPLKVLKNAFAHMSPGGWIEHQEGTPWIGCAAGAPEGAILREWSEQVVRGARALGRDLESLPRYKAWMVEAGFVDVLEIPVPMPIGSWPDEPKFKRAGQFMQLDFIPGLEDFSMKVLHGQGAPPARIKEIVSEVRAALVNPGVHAYIPGVTVIGRKPYEGETPAGFTSG